MEEKWPFSKNAAFLIKCCFFSPCHYKVGQLYSDHIFLIIWLQKRKVIIVTGYKSDLIEKRYLGNKKVVIVKNNKYLKTNMVYSLFVAKKDKTISALFNVKCVDVDDKKNWKFCFKLNIIFLRDNNKKIVLSLVKYFIQNNKNKSVILNP